MRKQFKNKEEQEEQEEQLCESKIWAQQQFN